MSNAAKQDVDKLLRLHRDVDALLSNAKRINVRASLQVVEHKNAADYATNVRVRVSPWAAENPVSFLAAWTPTLRGLLDEMRKGSPGVVREDGLPVDSTNEIVAAFQAVYPNL